MAAIPGKILNIHIYILSTFKVFQQDYPNDILPFHYLFLIYTSPYNNSSFVEDCTIIFYSIQTSIIFLESFNVYIYTHRASVINIYSILFLRPDHLSSPRTPPQQTIISNMLLSDHTSLLYFSCLHFYCTPQRSHVLESLSFF